MDLPTVEGIRRNAVRGAGGNGGPRTSWNPTDGPAPHPTKDQAAALHEVGQRIAHAEAVLERTAG